MMSSHNLLTENEIAAQLANSLSDLQLPEASYFGTSPSADLAKGLVSQTAGGMLSIISKYLADNAGLLPEKKAVITAILRAVDLGLDKLNRPFIVGAIRGSIRSAVVSAVDALYDAILNPAIEV